MLGKRCQQFALVTIGNEQSALMPCCRLTKRGKSVNVCGRTQHKGIFVAGHQFKGLVLQFLFRHHSFIVSGKHGALCNQYIDFSFYDKSSQCAVKIFA